jgi:hypothetical protein
LPTRWRTLQLFEISKGNAGGLPTAPRQQCGSLKGHRVRMRYRLLLHVSVNLQYLNRNAFDSELMNLTNDCVVRVE